MALAVKNPPANAADVRHGFDPWVRKIPWRRKWQPIPVFLPGESPLTEDPGRLQFIESQSWTQLKRLSTDHYKTVIGQRVFSNKSHFIFAVMLNLDFPGDSAVKNPPANAGDLGSLPGSGRSSGEGNGNPLQCLCLENPIGKGAWRDIVHGVAKNGT